MQQVKPVHARGVEDFHDDLRRNGSQLSRLRPMIGVERMIIQSGCGDRLEGVDDPEISEGCVLLAFVLRPVVNLLRRT